MQVTIVPPPQMIFVTIVLVFKPIMVYVGRQHRPVVYNTVEETVWGDAGKNYDR
jgi:hypothetical protein